MHVHTYVFVSLQELVRRLCESLDLGPPGRPVAFEVARLSLACPQSLRDSFVHSVARRRDRLAHPVVCMCLCVVCSPAQPVVDSEHLVFKFARLAKGRLLLFRALLLLPPQWAHSLVALMLAHFRLFALPDEPCATDEKLAQVAWPASDRSHFVSPLSALPCHIRRRSSLPAGCVGCAVRCADARRHLGVPPHARRGGGWCA